MFLVQVGETEKDLKLRVKKFSDQNYSLWKMKMGYYLHQKYLYLPLGGKLIYISFVVSIPWSGMVK